ncbi:TPA: MucBP domain-containing protein [Streptococcus suis]
MATGQAATVSQEVTENGENIVTVKVVKKADEKAATTSETTTSTETAKSSEAATTATDTETVKTPATVEEAKVVLEQVTSEAEVLANEAERLVAASDSDNTALKAAAAATKLTATEATAVLNDSAATLESVNAQIDAVRTNVEALALELRKYLGTDAIEIALTTVTDKNDSTNRPGYWTENEEVLNKDAATATATTKPQEQRIPAGYAVDPTDGRITFLIYSLSADDVDAGKAAGTKEGSYNLRYGTDYYITLSMDRTASDGVIYARLVSKQNGFIEEVAIPENTARHQFQAIANGPKNLGNFTYRMSLTTMPFTDATGQLTSVRYVNINAGLGDTGKGSVAYSLLTSDTTSYNSYTGLVPSILPAQVTDYLVKETDRRSEELLASYTHLALVSGDSFTISDAAEFANYELIEAPVIKDTPVSTNYAVGTPLIQYFPGPKTARVIYITKEDGTARFVNFMINPDHPDFIENFKNYDSMSPVDFVENGGAEALDFSSRIAIIDKYLAEIDAVKADTSLSSDQQASRLAELRANYATEINTDDNKFLLTFVSTEAEPLSANDGPDAVTGLTTWNHTVKNYYTNSNRATTIAYKISPYLNDPMVDWYPAPPTPQGTFLHSKTEVDSKGNPIALTIPGLTGNVRVQTNIIAMFNMLVANENNQHYYYAEKGGVKVYYVDTTGKVLQDAKSVYDHEATNTAYDTKSVKDETITTADGTVYYYKEIDTTGLNPASSNTDTEKRTIEKITEEVGTVAQDTLKELTYVYEQAGNVIVHYVTEDGTELSGTTDTGATTAATVSDTTNGKPGETYNTTDLKPKTITTADGKTYALVEASTKGEETGTVEAGKTKEVTYVYKEVKGSVVVNYVDENGNPISGTADKGVDGKEKEVASKVEDTPLSSTTNTGNGYDTTDNRPNTITTADGKVYKLVPAATQGNEAGDIVEGTTTVTYVYELLQGDVVVHYVDTKGNTIAKDVTDTQITDTGTDYNTKEDNKPEKIVNDETGKTYYILPKNEVKDGSAPEEGKVVEGTSHVTYVYQEAGNVNVNYVDTDGNPLIAPVADVTDGKPGSDYDTLVDNKPETIATADGKLYRLVPAGTYNVGTVSDSNNLTAAGNGTATGVDAVTGTVEAGTTKEITYVYEEVKGNVVVNYVNTDGKVIASQVDDTKTTSTGTDYNTTDNKPEKIVEDATGDVYYILPQDEVQAGSAPETGKVVEGTTEVTYVYQKAGNVVVNYITEDGTVIKDPVNDETNQKPGTEYNTTDNKPTTITTKDGKTYELIPAATRGNETGDVEAGKTTEVTYVYKEVKGSVVVNYISTTGEELQAQVVDTPESSTGTGYDTTDVKPETITTKDGRTFKLVPKMTQGSETGDVVPGVTEVTYVYEEVKGDVVVNYVNTDGKVIATPVVDTKTTSTGTAYDTTDNKPEKIVEDATGDVYYILPTDEVKAGDKETGKVVEGTTEVTYIYQKAGNVVVNYITEDGTVIKQPVNDETNQKPGTEYNTTDNKHETITTTDGKVYKLVPAATIGNETGDVEAGKTTEITYVYKEVTSDVVVEYYNTAGEVIAKTVVDEDDKSVGTDYDTDVDNKPEKITTEDGTVYYYKEVKDSSAPTTGKVAETTTTVQYVYEKAGNVVVNYITEDGTVIKDPVKDEENAEPGKTYSTEDNKPTTITTEDGKTYKLVPNATTGEENGTITSGEDKQVTYVYEEVKGSVVVNYVTTDGTVLQDPVTDTPETSTGTPYDTTDVKPGTITTADGKTYKLVPTLTKGSETGDVVPGVTEVTYVYEEVKGDVVVNYVNTDGKVIASQVVDTKTTSTGTAYDTTDNKPAKITTEDGTVYYYKEVDAKSATETGNVVEGTTEVTYVYEKAGSVTVNYVTTDGTVIKSPVKDEENEEPGKSYSTEDNKPTTITTEDGTTYELVPSATIGTENGEVESGKTTEVTYVYRKVETPAAKTGNVVVEYYNTAGEKIATDVVDTPETTTGTVYETLDFKPATITKDGVTYFYKEVKDTSAAEKGTVVEGTTTVQYVYEPAGSVTVNYVTTNGTVIKSPVKDEENAEPGKTYSTEDNKPTTITTEDGKTYKLVPSSTTGEENGSVTSGEDKQVTYVYEEVKGDVVVNYIDTEGNVIKAPVTDTPSTSTGTAYDTTDNKPETITYNGEEYKLVPVLTKGNENGSVVEGTTQVTYVYQKVTTPAPNPNGSVVVNYVNTNGETIATSVNDTTDAALDTTYDTTDFKPAVIKHNGVTYYYKEVKAGDSETGKVVEGTTSVTYVYEPAGSVTVNYVTTDGTVIKTPVKDEENAEPGKTYSTEDNKPTTITTEDGKTYKLVPSLTTGEENGSVTSGENKQVTYVYEEVKGNVVVNYIDTEGNVIASPVEDTASTSTGTGYNTTDNKPTTITTADGSVYELVPVLTQGNENGSVVEGTTEVTYVYRKVSSAVKSPVTNHVDENGKSISPQEDGTKPNTSISGYEFTGKTTVDKDGNVTHVYRKVTPKGTVVVNYITEDGTVISKPVTDTPSSDVDTPYDTTDNKPGTITFNGEEYELVRVDGTENGKVVEGETVVTYVYRKVTPAKKVVTNHVDENGNPIAPQEDGTTPNKSIPGYEFTGKTTTDENGNTTHVYRKVTPAKKVVTNHVDEEGNVISPQEDGTTPNKSIPGYEFTGKKITDENGNTTHVYRKKVNVVITYVDTNGVELKASVVDTEGAADGTAYNTKQNDNEYPLYIVKGDAVYKRVLAGDFTVGQTTEDGHLVSSDAVDGAVAAGTKVVTYVYELVTPAKTVVTNHVDEEGNVISPKEDGTKPNTSIPGYEFTGKTTVDEDGNVTHVYRKVKAVVTKHVDEEGNVISPQEDGTTPDKSIPGYEFTGKTITLPNGDTLHIYRKVTTPVTPEPGRPGTPVTPEPGRPGTPVTPAPGKPATPAPAKPATPATPVSGKAQLPNTGEASSSASILGASMLVAALALVGKRRRNNED